MERIVIDFNHLQREERKKQEKSFENVSKALTMGQSDVNSTYDDDDDCRQQDERCIGGGRRRDPSS